MTQKKRNVEPGTPKVDSKYSIVIDRKGPYFVYGQPPLKQEFIMPNEEGSSWEYVPGENYSTADEPTALCRCGASKHKPYCDGAHVTADWDPALTADNVPLLERADVIEGPTLDLTDNERYCAFARFCDAYGKVWNLVEESDDGEARELTIRESNYCPAGRLKTWDKEKGEFIEHHLKPALSLIEDPVEDCSGPLWVKGGIPINDDKGVEYELRNRVTLCRCGVSSNKPFCDGSHASIHFQDELPQEPKK
ncbi:MULTISPECIES: CDGSH iron-sulfur domain-containing protein [Porphyromonadaceae]|uniref:CDGSH iron-sulfur domain-containing protein n=1 Tax=Porphyromonadaceae TaxID=171551 RepID=UPI00073F1C72|nr:MULTISPECIES: CDGSH iron-sulfur domain-containing protein [Porphyromonadaceae]